MHHYEQLELWKRGITLSAQLLRAARAARADWRDRALWDQMALASGVLEEAEARTLADEVAALRRMASALRARANGYRLRPPMSLPRDSGGAGA